MMLLHDSFLTGQSLRCLRMDWAEHARHSSNKSCRRKTGPPINCCHSQKNTPLAVLPAQLQSTDKQEFQPGRAISDFHIGSTLIIVALCCACRVLLSNPRLVLMDESTSALDTTNEALMYRLLSDSNITYVSIGHRPTLVNFHDQVLYLQARGGNNQNGSQASFQLVEASQARAAGVMTDA